jgi:class 3 adenylate cyclase
LIAFGSLEHEEWGNAIMCIMLSIWMMHEIIKENNKNTQP